MLTETFLEDLRKRVVCVSGQEVEALLNEIESLQAVVLKYREGEPLKLQQAFDQDTELKELRQKLADVEKGVEQKLEAERQKFRAAVVVTCQRFGLSEAVQHSLTLGAVPYTQDPLSPNDKAQKERKATK